MSSLQAHHRHRLSTCRRHPTANPVTGFCASCLCERLSTIEDSVNPISPNTSPRLRRTKSYSSTANKHPNAVSSTSEPRRKSCDVGAHPNTLSTLFTLADGDESKPKRHSCDPIRNAVVVLKEEEDEVDEDGEFRTMKEFIDLELESNNGRFSFWESTASAFSKKLLKWKQKQQRRTKKENEGFVADAATRGKVEAESEIGLYGYLGRRSCDTDPRLSVDNGRYSFDEPRASWDGYLFGKAYPRLLAPPMPIVDEKESDKEKEKESEGNEGEKSPGGSEQTRDYYGESLILQRRRRSFDKSSSVKRPGLVDVDEVNGSNYNKQGLSNAKVSPENIGLFHGAKLLVTEKELRDSNWYSIKDYRAECVESDSKNAGIVSGGGNEKGFKFNKPSRRRNVWNMWGLIQKRNEGKSVDDDKFIGGKVNVVDEPLVQKLKRVANGEANGTVSEKLFCSYSVSARNSFQVDGSADGVDGMESGAMKKDELVLRRNSTAYSSGNLDNGLLRFYLTPMRSYRRSKSGRSGIKNLQSMAMSGL